MARRVGVWSEGALGAALRLLILVGLPLAGCDTSLAVPDPGTEGSTEDVSSGLPSRSDTEGASSEPGATVNACGGETELRWEGEPALLLSPCGASGEGVLVCAGLNVLRCLGEATGTNACGGRGVLGAEPGAPCGVCAGEEGSGTWICDATAEAGVRCEGARAPNVCGGCALLTGRPGASCTDSAGEPGRWACSSADALVCAAEAENACGGSGTLRHEGEVALPGDACERPCGRGVLQCTSAESLGCASTGEEA